MILKTEEQVREAARKMLAKKQREKEQDRAQMKQLLDEIQKEDGTDDGLREIGALLMLSEESFAILAPAFLAEVEKSMNSFNDKILLAQMLNTMGLRALDIDQEFSQLCEEIDKEFTGVLSQQKIDFLKQLISYTYNAFEDTEGVAKRFINIPYEQCHKDAKIPTYAHNTDAGMDLYAVEDITINPGETKLVPTGIKVAIPLGYELQVRPRSGMSLRSKLRIANTPGTIDSGYRGEIGVIIENIDPPIRAIHTENLNDPNAPIPVGAIDFGSSFTIHKGERFAQLVLSEVPKAVFYKVDSVADIGEDRKGGFGSTDKEN